MLKILRDNLKYLSWILWIVILVFVAFVFVDFGGGLSGRGGGPGAAAAWVGDQTIGLREYERAYKQLEDQYRNAFGGQWTSEMADRMQLPQQAMSRLVNRALLAQAAHDQGIRVSDAAVRDAVLSLPQLVDASGNFVGEERYRVMLRNLGFTPREFEAAMREDLLIQRFSALVESGVVVPDPEVERAWRSQNEKASIRYLLASGSRYQAQATPSAAEVEAYFKSHPAEFHLPEQRVVDYLLVDAAKLRSKIQIDPADVKSEYEAHQDQYTTPERVHARHILVKVDENRSLPEAQKLMATIQAKLAKGEPFEKLAAEYSEDPGSKDRGGDLGSFGRGQMVPPFEEAAFSAKPDTVVGPVKSSFGLHLIQVLEHTQQQVEPLAAVEPQIRARLAGERAQKEAEARARSLAQRVEREHPSTDEAWRKLADGDVVEYLETPKFARNEPVPGIGADPGFAGAAFALASPGASSSPVQVPRGWAILRLKQIAPPHQPELAEVEAKVRAAATREKANQLARADLDRARSQLAGGATLDAVAKSLGLEVRDSGEFTSEAPTLQGLGSAPRVAEAAMALGQGQVGGPVVTPAGAVLFEVTSRTPFDAAKFAAEKESTRESLRQAEANRLLGSLLDKQREATSIRYDPQLVERMKLGTATG